MFHKQEFQFRIPLRRMIHLYLCRKAAETDNKPVLVNIVFVKTEIKKKLIVCIEPERRKTAVVRKEKIEDCGASDPAPTKKHVIVLLQFYGLQ